MIVRNGKTVTSIIQNGKIIKKVIKLRNLFNILKRTLGELTSGGVNTETRAFEYDKYYLGLTLNNYYYPWQITSYSITEEEITLETVASGYGIALPYKVVAGEKYIASADGEGAEIAFSFYDVDGNWLTYINHTTDYITVPENCVTMAVILRPQYINTLTTYTNIKVLKLN